MLDTNDAEACGTLIAAGKAEGGLAAALSLLANEALYERDVAVAAEARLLETVNAMRAEIVRLRGELAAAQLVLMATRRPAVETEDDRWFSELRASGAV